MWLLADAREAMQILRESTFAWVSLAAALVILAVVAVWLRSRFRDDSGPAAESDRMLMLVSELRREGEISDEEFRNIESRLLTHGERDANAPDLAKRTPERDTMTDH